MYVRSENMSEAGYSPAKSPVGGKGISSSFLKALYGKMGEWLKTLSDGKITQGEIVALNNMTAENPVINPFSLEEQGEVVYEGPVANLHVTAKISEISDLISWMFKFESQKTELHNKASNMLGG